MNSRIIIIILSVIIAVLVSVNIWMFRDHGEPPFMPGPGQEFMGGGPGPGMMGGHHMSGNRFGRNFCGPDFMREKLNLNSDQIEKIEDLNANLDRDTSAIFEKMRPERDRLRNIMRPGNKPDMTEVRKSLEKLAAFNVEIQLLRIKQGSEIDSILSPDQKETLRKERDSFFERMQRRQGYRNE